MKKLLVIFCLLITRYSGAQDYPLLTISVDSATFPELIDVVEKQTKYQVFYKNEWVDSLRYTFSLAQKPLNVVLDTLVRGTKLQYYIHDKQVFITNNVTIISTPKIAELLENKPSEIQNNVEKGLIFARDYRNENGQGTNQENQVLEIGSRQKLASGRTATVAGYIKEKGSGEALVGVLVYHEKTGTTATTDPSGFYSITIPVGKQKLVFKLVGMEPAQRDLALFSNGQLNVDMLTEVMALREVIINSDRGANVENVQMGVSNLKIAEIKNVPIVLGERDVMKVATTLAGIKTVGEGAAGFNVRGGKSDQNLITLDGAPIYNTSHFLGFFSVFNSEAIEDMQIYKGSIPARYGGRLSSVMDISSLRANRDSISGSGGVSPITSKLTLELPLFKGKGGLMLGGRTTYSNWVLRNINNAEFRQNRVSFSDFILRHDLDINPNNKLTLSGYYSTDLFTRDSSPTDDFVPGFVLISFTSIPPESSCRSDIE